MDTIKTCDCWCWIDILDVEGSYFWIKAADSGSTSMCRLLESLYD